MLDGNKVTEKDVEESVIKTEFVKLPDGRTTICLLTLYNGFTLRGESACVDISNYDRVLGEKYALLDAKRKIWAVLGAILAEKLYQAKQHDSRTGSPGQ